MAQFFRKSTDQHEFNSSRSGLEAELLRFKRNQISGAFEIQAGAEELELLVLGDGEETGAYRLYPDSRSKITPDEIGMSWEGLEVPIRSVALPDQASRAIWQAMEFEIAGYEEIPGPAGWKAFMDRCYSERFTGMVGIRSELGDGFAFLHDGLGAASEIVVCSAEGFSNKIDAILGSLESVCQLTLYKADPVTQAYQVSLLRLGVADWGKRILANYKDMVGQKLLYILNTSLNSMLMHRQSNIYLTDIDIIDNHFFFECQTAAEVYQTLLLNMYQLIGRVIGGMVTRRIISSTYERLAASQQEILSTNTLAPAAFLR